MFIYNIGLYMCFIYNIGLFMCFIYNIGLYTYVFYILASSCAKVVVMAINI